MSEGNPVTVNLSEIQAKPIPSLHAEDSTAVWNCQCDLQDEDGDACDNDQTLTIKSDNKHPEWLWFNMDGYSTDEHGLKELSLLFSPQQALEMALSILQHHGIDTSKLSQ